VDWSKSFSKDYIRTEIAATTLIQWYAELETAELRKLQAAENLDKYHAETKSWRDKKILRKISIQETWC
jgi:hypothetical protein